MSGINKIVLDTNVISDILIGKSDSNFSNYDEIFISVISELEFLSSINLSKQAVDAFEELKSRVSVVYIEKDNKLRDAVINLRKKNKLKLPDAIIAATAITKNALLLTNDKNFKNIKGLKVISLG